MNGNVKIIGAAAIAYGIFYYTNGVAQVSNGAIVVGSPKYTGIGGGKILLQIPISNLSNVSINFTGLNARIDCLKNGVTRTLGTVQIVDQKKPIKPNTTETFNVGIDPNYASLLFLGLDIATGNFKFRELNATLKGAAFTTLLTIPLDNPIF